MDLAMTTCEISLPYGRWIAKGAIGEIIKRYPAGESFSGKPQGEAVLVSFHQRDDGDGRRFCPVHLYAHEWIPAEQFSPPLRVRDRVRIGACPEIAGFDIAGGPGVIERIDGDSADVIYTDLIVGPAGPFRIPLTALTRRDS